MLKPAKQAADAIREFVPDFTPQIGIVLGSGLGPIADALTDCTTINYDDITGFPPCTVSGHSGALHLGYLEGIPVACLQGRAHFYEGYHYLNQDAHVDLLTSPVRALKLLGCETLLATNSSGSLRPEVTPGNLVVIKDHINFQFRSPLVGPNDNEFGPRFIGMENAYDSAIREKIRIAAATIDIPITEGVYIGVLGPAFETPAEIRAFRILGADVVGMSTVPEVITARHCGMKVAVISAITNMAAGMSEEELSHDVTLRGAKKAVDRMIALVREVIKTW